MLYGNIEQLRDAIKEVPTYKKSQSWAKKVDKMPDDQVIAIWISFKKRGLIK